MDRMEYFTSSFALLMLDLCCNLLQDMERIFQSSRLKHYLLHAISDMRMVCRKMSEIIKWQLVTCSFRSSGIKSDFIRVIWQVLVFFGLSFVLTNLFVLSPLLVGRYGEIDVRFCK